MNQVTFNSAAATATLLIATISTPLTASAETNVFSGKGAYGEISGHNGNLYLYADAFEEVFKSKANKNKSAGVYISGYNYTSSACWYTYFEHSNDVEFKATGSLPRHVIASGSAEVTWNDYCGGNSPITGTVTISIDLTAMTDEAFSSWGTSHSEYPDHKYNYHFNYSSAPAYASADSFISSPAFGDVGGDTAQLGQSKSHEIEIVK